MTFRGMAGVCLVVLLGSVVGCTDDLANNPGGGVGVCDETLLFDITDVPAEVLYTVFWSGPAVVNTITYTLPTGDSTIVNPTAALDETWNFTMPTSAQLHVTGDVATGGEIAIGYAIQLPHTGDDFVVCNG